jgi:hypothetical protein
MFFNHCQALITGLTTWPNLKNVAFVAVVVAVAIAVAVPVAVP